MSDQTNTTGKSELERSAAKLLQQLGIPVKILGYDYLKTAIMVKAESHGKITLYDITAKIADEYGTTPPRVVRNIHYAIEMSMKNGDLRIIEKVFPLSDVNEPRISISRFIAGIAEYLRLETIQEEQTV